MNSEIKKKCRYCGKEVQNLGFHIVNIHPNIMEQLNELSADTPQIEKTPITPPPAQIYRPATNINNLINEKLETMLNIKIIEMLSKSPDTSLKEIAQTLNPPPVMGLKEIKEYHDLVYPSREEVEMQNQMPNINIPSGEGNEWIEIIKLGLPLLMEMLKGRKQTQNTEVVKNGEFRSIEGGGLQSIKPIQEQTSTDKRKSDGASEESRTPSETEQQNNRIVAITDGGINEG